MSTAWIRRIAPVVVLVALLGGCRDKIAGPVAGELTLSLTTPHADDGAIVLSITGPGEVGSLEAVNPGHLLHSRQEGTTLRAVIFGELTSGALLRFMVPDIDKPDLYTVRVLEVSDRSNALRESTTGYQLGVKR